MTDISYLAKFGGGGSLGEFFPWAVAPHSVFNLKNSAGAYNSNNVNFWGESGLASNSLYEVPEMFRTIIDNDDIHTKELCNISSINGGVLTHILTPCMDTNNGVIEVEVVRDGTKTTTYQRTLTSAGIVRLALGGVSVYTYTASAAACVGIGSGTEGGFNPTGYGIMTPLQALHLGIGLQFESTCVVTVKSITGNLQIATNTLGYKAACLGMLRKFGE